MQELWRNLQHQPRPVQALGVAGALQPLHGIRAEHQRVAGTERCHIRHLVGGTQFHNLAAVAI